MNNEKNSYVKVILYAYPHLKSLQEALEDSIANKALLSYRQYDTQTAAERIADEIFLKASLQRLEEDLNRIIGRLDEEERYLLDYKYFHRKDAICPLRFSERSYYRKQQNLLNKLKARLNMCGWTQETFLSEFARSVFFMRVYRAVCDGEERKLVRKRAKKTLGVSQMKSSVSSR